ncbi:uncharacterized protein LOC131325298 [Rhododendron vialii]|uniref:uncharacterized protein LOC131325298 n=1 Tax=Rhododendron vialii TaxID=182163 RepID=UPI00265EA6A4|nr:uncharacterized protein LOC131325298 [Rhododendron vialii]
MWKIWKCRNDEVFNSKGWRPDVACRSAVLEATEFLEANRELNVSRGRLQALPAEHYNIWEKPMRGWFKINFDGGLDNRSKSSGVGIIIRDEFGIFRAARAIYYGNLMSPVVIEALAARDGLLFAREMGLRYIQLEGDSQQIINLIQKKEDSNIEVGVIIADVNKLRDSFEGSKVSFVRRVGNSVAHLVAKNAARGSGIRTWEYYPLGFTPPFMRIRAQTDVLIDFLIIILS